MVSLFFNLIPLCVLINFLLLIVLTWYNRKEIKNRFKNIKSSIWFFLLLILLFGLLLRVLATTPHLEMYIDEPWYIDTAVNILEHGTQGNYVKSIGWPFILTIPFLIFGVSNYAAIYTSLLFAILSAVVIFLLSYLIFKNQYLSLSSALIFLLFPVHIFWSTTAETNVTSTFFILLGILFAFLYYSNNTSKLYWLALAANGFVAQIRPENYFFILLFFSGCLIFNNIPQKFNFKNDFLPVLFLAFLVLPNLIQVLNFQSRNYQEITGLRLSSLNSLTKNTIDGFFLIPASHHWLLSILGLIGIFNLFFKKRKIFYFTVLWLTGLWIIYYSSYINILGGQSRIYISFYPITTIYVSAGILYIIQLLSQKTKYKIFITSILSISLFIFLFLDVTKNTPLVSNEKILLNKLPELISTDLPPDCVIIATEPLEISALTSFQTIRLDYFLDLPLQNDILKKNQCVLFFEDYLCKSKTDQNYTSQCSKIKKKYNMSLLKTYTEKNASFNFYSLKTH